MNKALRNRIDEADEHHGGGGGNGVGDRRKDGKSER